MSKTVYKPEMKIRKCDLPSIFMKMASGELILFGGSMFTAEQNDKLLIDAYARLPDYNTMSAVNVSGIGTLMFLSREIIY